VQERRKVTRSRVLKGAKIIIGSASTIDCVVRNVTNSGARIQIANTVDLPETLDLTLDAGFTIRPCRVAWRSVTESGLQFI
jgi:PilZ domain-containing protein